MEETPLLKAKPNAWNSIRNTLYIIGMLALFLFAIDLMVSSLQHLGKNTIGMVTLATSNPFTGLFIGLLITAMIQSSSTTTAMTVALVASGSITLQNAVPIIMGANIGTTITSSIVSLGFINKRKEFQRAVAGGTYHSVFNILTAVILFPLEYYYGILSSLSQKISLYFFTPVYAKAENQINHFWSGFDPVINFLVEHISSGVVLTILSFSLLFTSIIIFRKLISNILLEKNPERFNNFFFRNKFKSFLWGLVATAAIRSSTITTSLVVPLVAKKIIKLSKAAPFILGANIGTTVTAFIAATLNSNTADAVSIAIAHFLFNFIGVLIFFPVPFLQKIPVNLANKLGKLTLRYRLSGFLYILMTFFFIPFSLIYFNPDSTRILEMTYEKSERGKEKTFYRLEAKTNTRNRSGEWLQYSAAEMSPGEVPEMIFPVSNKNNILFVKEQMYLFNKPGFCWKGKNEKGDFEACIDSILSELQLTPELRFDSVYVYRKRHATADSISTRTYVSAPYAIILKHETLDKNGLIVASEKVIRFDEK